MGKKYTIIISPSDLKPVRKIVLHQPTIWLVLFSFVLLVVYGILGTIKFCEENQIGAKYVQIEREKQELEAANKILTQIRKKESMIRKFLGLEQHFDETGGFGGQGGSGLDGVELEDFLQKEKTGNISWHQLNIKSKELTPFEEGFLLDRDLQEIIDFIDNQKSELATLPTISPIAIADAWISSGFGIRKSPFTGLREFHSGVDISAMRGTKIIAPADGKVFFVGSNGGLGKAIKIRHNDHYETIYGHLLKYNVKKNQRVKRGDVIGYVGKTGRSTGYHVHYEVHKDGKRVDPYSYLLNWRKRHLVAANDSTVN